MGNLYQIGYLNWLPSITSLYFFPLICCNLTDFRSLIVSLKLSTTPSTLMHVYTYNMFWHNKFQNTQLSFLSYRSARPKNNFSQQEKNNQDLSKTCSTRTDASSCRSIQSFGWLQLWLAFGPLELFTAVVECWLLNSWTSSLVTTESCTTNGTSEGW